MGIRDMGGKWQYRFRVQGQDVCVMTGLAATERNRKKAEQQEAAHRQAILDGRWGTRLLVPRMFTSVQEDFMEWCQAEYRGRENTWRRIKTSMASCSVFFGKQMVSSIHPGEIERYKVWRMNSHGDIPSVKDVTVKHDLDNLSIFFQWAVKQNFARVNPVKEVKRPSARDAIRERILSFAEEKLYFAHATGNLAKVARLILLQGIRPDEAMRIRKEDVDLERGDLHIKYGKSKAARRTLKLTVESKSILAAQMQSEGPWVFPSPRAHSRHITKLNCPHDRLLDKLNPCRSCGGRESQHPSAKCATFSAPYTPLWFVLYDLRHTFATRMVQGGCDLASLKVALGHENVQITMRYVHVSQGHVDQAMTVYSDQNEERRAKERVQ